MKTVALDLEANGLLYAADKLHCIYDHEGNELSPEDLNSVRAIFHNGEGYDLPLLEKLHSVAPVASEDTMILSRLKQPDILGGHSIDAWGKRVGIAKEGKDIDDWSECTDLMRERCASDAAICWEVWKRHEHMVDSDVWKEAIALEYAVARYHAKQVLNGVCFDMEKANALADELDESLLYIRKKIMRGIPVFPRKHLTPVKAPFLKTGGYSKATREWYPDDPSIVAGPYSRLKYMPLNLDSPTQVKDYLLKFCGWVPIEHTPPSDTYPEGSPKLTEESYPSIKGGIGQLIAEKNVLTHRRNMVRNINKKGEKKGFVYAVRDDGRIEADALTLGAATGRYAHIGVANLPRVTTPYGREIRELFCVPANKVMLGWDLAGIENRIAAHYLWLFDGGEFAKEVLEGDFHQTTADSLGISRDEAKTFRYMTLYGGQPPKIAATMGWTLAKARRIYKAFWEANPALSKLNDILQMKVKRGYIIGLDGRHLKPRSSHALINFLFQSAATIVFKRAIVLLNEKCDEEGLDWKQLWAYHDEIGAELLPEDVDIYERLSNEAVKEAGEYYKLKVPITADVHRGMNWAEVH